MTKAYPYFLGEGRYMIVDVDGKQIGDKEYENINPFETELGLAVFKRNGKEGVVNTSGEEIIPAMYDSVQLEANCAFVSDGEKAFFVNAKNERISEDIETNIKTIGRNRAAKDAKEILFALRDKDTDTEWAINGYGEVIIPKDKHYLNINDNGYLTVFRNNILKIYDSYGKLKKELKWPYNSNPLLTSDLKYFEVDTMEGSGIISFDGEVIVEPKYELALVTAEDVFQVSTGEKSYCIGPNGKKYFDGKGFDMIEQASSKVLLMKDGEEWYHADTQEMELHRCLEYKDILYTHDGKTFITPKDIKRGDDELLKMMLRLKSGSANVDKEEIIDVLERAGEKMMRETIVRAGCENKASDEDSWDDELGRLSANIRFEEGVTKIGEGWGHSTSEYNCYTPEYTITLPSTIEEVAPNAFKDYIPVIYAILAPSECLERYKKMFMPELANKFKPLELPGDR